MKLDDENIVSFAKKLKAPIRVGKVSVLCATYLPTLPIHCEHENGYAYYCSRD